MNIWEIICTFVLFFDKCKIERGNRCAKREQIAVIAKLLQIGETELV
jgi:hypothetical protein